MSLTVYYFLIVLVACAATVLTRAFPFILFVKRPLPAFLRYLGRVLPSSIIVILLIYCVREQLFWKGNQSIAIVSVLRCSFYFASSFSQYAVKHQRSYCYFICCCFILCLEQGIF